MVVIPFVSNQPMNASCIEKLGVGKKMNYSDANRDVLKTTVFSVFTDNKIKYNIEKVQRLIKDSPGNKGGAEIIIDYCQKCN